MGGDGFFLQAIGLEDARGLISQLDHELKQGLRERLREAATIVRDDAAGRSQSARVRGAMSFTVEVKSLTEFQARIGPTRRRAWFAHFLEFGVAPHAIPNAYGKPGNTLMHPGHRAFPFLAPALSATEDQVVELVGIPPVLSSHSGGAR